MLRKVVKKTILELWLVFGGTDGLLFAAANILIVIMPIMHYQHFNN